MSRQPVQPVARTFSATPVRPTPPATEPAPATPQPASEPFQQVTFAPRSFDPPTQQKKPTVPWRTRLTAPTASRKIRAAAAVLGLLIIVSGAAVGAHAGKPKSDLGIKPHGRKIAIGEPTIGDGQLETSCYTLNLPAQYQVSHIAGCGSELSIPQGSSSSLISIVGTPSTSAFDLKLAPQMIRDQLKLISPTISQFQTVKTTVNDVTALKVLYSLNNGPEQVMVYIPSLPAQYFTDSQPAGAFMIRGYYSNSQQQANFDTALNSIHWVR